MSAKIDSMNASWRWAIILTVVLGLYFLKAFLGVIALAFLLAYIFYPMQQSFERTLKKKGFAIAATTVVSILILAIPVILIIILAISQATHLINNLHIGNVMVGQSSLDSKALTIVHELNDKINSSVGIKDAISDSGVVNFLHTTLPAMLKFVVKTVVGVVSGIPGFFTMFIIYLFVFTAALGSGDKLVKIIKQISPFDDDINNIYVNKIGAMAKAMVKGQLLIALLQGIVSAGVLALVGFGGYFWFMAVIFTFLSFIPLGAGIVTIPIGIIMILFGNFAGGLIVLLNHFLIITNIDNYVRPKVVPDAAKLPAVLTILGAFAGVGYFGFLGVIYGPIIMIIFTTTIEAYIKQNKESKKSTA